MKKVRCKFCRKKTDMEQLDRDWQQKFYKCPRPDCGRENPKRTFLGKTACVGKFVLRVTVYPILCALGAPPPE